MVCAACISIVPCYAQTASLPNQPVPGLHNRTAFLLLKLNNCPPSASQDFYTKIRTGLVGYKHVLLIPEEEIRAAARSAQLDIDCHDAERAREYGKNLNAEYVIMGSVTRITQEEAPKKKKYYTIISTKKYRVILNIIDMSGKTSNAEIAADIAQSDIDLGIQHIVTKLIEYYDERIPAAPPVEMPKQKVFLYHLYVPAPTCFIPFGSYSKIAVPAYGVSAGIARSDLFFKNTFLHMSGSFYLLGSQKEYVKELYMFNTTLHAGYIFSLYGFKILPEIGGGAICNICTATKDYTLVAANANYKTSEYTIIDADARYKTVYYFDPLVVMQLGIYYEVIPRMSAFIAAQYNIYFEKKTNATYLTLTCGIVAHL